MTVVGLWGKEIRITFGAFAEVRYRSRNPSRNVAASGMGSI